MNHERLNAELFEQPFDVGKFLAFGVEGARYCYPFQFVSLHSRNLFERILIARKKISYVMKYFSSVFRTGVHKRLNKVKYESD